MLIGRDHSPISSSRSSGFFLLLTRPWPELCHLVRPQSGFAALIYAALFGEGDPLTLPFVNQSPFKFRKGPPSPRAEEPQRANRLP